MGEGGTEQTAITEEHDLVLDDQQPESHGEEIPETTLDEQEVMTTQVLEGTPAQPV